MGPERNPANVWLKVAKIAFAAAFAFLAARLFYIQVVRHGDYYADALAQHRLSITLHARRGRILDRNGKPLADSLDAFSVWLYKPRVPEGELGLTAMQLASVLGGSSADLLRRLADGPSYVRVARHVDPKTAERLRNLGIPALDFSHDPVRFYPNGHTAAQLIGFCDADSKGIEGVEAAFDRYLRGKDGFRLLHRDALGRPISSPFEAEVPPRKGYDVRLTIDLWIQTILEEELGEACLRYRPKAGLGVVLDIPTGEVLAMASWPFFDPNRFNLYPKESWRNRVLCDFYEPGSMAKAFTAAAALEYGVMTPDTVIDCEGGRYALHGRVIKDAGHHGFHELTLTYVIAKSSNVGAAKIGEAVGAERLFRMLERFGFRSLTGVGLPGERRSLLRPVSRWTKQSVASISFGYEMCVTPLALVRAYAAIASDGTLPSLRVVSSVLDGHGEPLSLPSLAPKPRKRAISPATARKLRKILRKVVLNGTCRRALIPEYAIAGKTGTAVKVVNGRYDWSKTLSSFIGFAPLREPRLLVLVSLDEPTKAQYGGTVAGPAVRDVLRRSLEYLGVPHDPADETTKRK